MFSFCCCFCCCLFCFCFLFGYLFVWCGLLFFFWCVFCLFVVVVVVVGFFCGGWAVQFWDNRKRPWLPYSAQMFIFITSHLSFEYHGIYYSNTIKSQDFIGHIQKHFITSPLTNGTNGIQDFVECCIKMWVQFDPKTFSLVDVFRAGVS